MNKLPLGLKDLPKDTLVLVHANKGEGTVRGIIPISELEEMLENKSYKVYGAVLHEVDDEEEYYRSYLE